MLLRSLCLAALLGNVALYHVQARHESPSPAFEATGHTLATISSAITWSTAAGFVPMLEGRAEIDVDANEVGRAIAPGFRWELRGGWALGASVLVPLGTSTEQFRLVSGVVRHFPLGH